MPKCNRCVDLKEQIGWLRQQNKDLADRLLAISNPNALVAYRPDYSPQGDFYGSSSNDRVMAIDEFGQEVAIDKDKLE